MSRGKDKSATNAGSASPNSWTATFDGYVNYEWTDADKEAFIIWTGENNFWDIRATQTNLGRKFSISFDPKQSCYIATCFERDAKSPNAGLCVSARGRELEMAEWRILFLVNSLMGANWKNGRERKGDDVW